MIGLLLRRSALSSVFKIVGVGLTFCMMALLSRLLGEVNFGSFATCFSVSTILGFFLTFGQHISILRFWPLFDSTRGEAYATHALIFTMTPVMVSSAIVLCIGGIIFLIPWEWDSAVLVFWTGALALGFALSEYLSAALRAFGHLSLALLPREVLWRLCVLAWVLFISNDLNDSGAVALCASTLILVCFPQLPTLYRQLEKRRLAPCLDAADKAKMSRASVGVWGASVVGPLGMHIGTVMVGLLLGPLEAGAFFAADRLARLLSLALMGVNQIAAPTFSRIIARGDADLLVQTLVKFCVMSGLASLAGFLIYLIAGEFFLSIFSSEYVPFYSVLIVLSVGQVVNGLAGPNNMLLYMAGRERIFLLIMSVSVFIGTAIMVPLGQSLGVVGVAMGSTFTVFVWNIGAIIVCLSTIDRIRDC